MESWRLWLYPLGFLSAAAFGGRFIAQWISSERKKESIVPPLFWKLSLVGNLALLFHSIIQLQYHVAFVQSANAIISWRNLDLMKQEGERASLSTVFSYLILAVLSTTVLFILQTGFALEEWFRIPTANSFFNTPAEGFWHLIGLSGLLLFSSRFWIQWWYAEKIGKSYLCISFWWLSLLGSLLNIAYFIRISDFVNIFGHALGVIPYIRNLMLITSKQKVAKDVVA